MKRNDKEPNQSTNSDTDKEPSPIYNLTQHRMKQPS